MFFMKGNNYVIGVDYGTDSVRTLLVDADSGNEIATSVFEYPRWKVGKYCNPAENQFRQHPLDYIEGMEYTIKECIAKAGEEIAGKVRAISFDTTGSTPVAVNEEGIPLAMLEGFQENPEAMFLLWKDHTAIQEAEEINKHAENFKIDYLQYCGGIYSSEWFWAKMLHVLRKDAKVAEVAYTFVEHSDWMPFLLTGGKQAKDIKRNVCAAGHKGMWAEELGGFPPEEFFSELDPLLSGQVAKLSGQLYTTDTAAGNLSPQWAEKLGLSTDVKVGIGAIDAHVGAVGGEIEPYCLSKVMGTSTCDMLVIPKSDISGKVVKGISGQVAGSIIPGMIGLEAGQSAFGDVYAWFKEMLLWPLKNYKENNTIDDALYENISKNLLKDLELKAAQSHFDEDSEIAVDWLNGRRTPDVNPLLKGAVAGLTLGSSAPLVYRALVESTCFGAKRIIERYRNEGANIKGIIALGGIARKSDFVMQTLADILEMPIKVNASDQTCALGATMFAATVAGVYNNVHDAMKNLGKGFDKYFQPNTKLEDIYRKRYEKYINLCNALEHEIQ